MKRTMKYVGGGVIVILMVGNLVLGVNNRRKIKENKEDVKLLYAHTILKGKIINRMGKIVKELIRTVNPEKRKGIK